MRVDHRERRELGLQPGAWPTQRQVREIVEAMEDSPARHPWHGSVARLAQGSVDEWREQREIALRSARIRAEARRLADRLAALAADDEVEIVQP